MLVNEYTEFIKNFAMQDDRFICVLEQDETYVSALRMIKVKADRMKA